MLNSAFSSFAADPATHVWSRTRVGGSSTRDLMQLFLKMEKSPSIKSNFLPVLYYFKSLFVKGVAIIICIWDINFITLPPGFAMEGSGNNHGYHFKEWDLGFVFSQTNRSWDTQPGNACTASSTSPVVTWLSPLANVCIVIYLFI